MTKYDKNIPNLRFKDFSDHWKTKMLSEFELKVIDGDRGTNYPNGDDFSSTGYCLFMNAKNVTKSGFSFEEKIFISKEKDAVLRKGKLKRNDLVLTTRGSVGNIAFYNSKIEFDHLRINSGMVIIRNENNEIDPNFIYSSFYSPKVDRQLKTISFGSAQPQLTVKEINRFKLAIPSLPEQQKIAYFLSAVDEKIQQLTRKKELLEQYKKGVMQQLFSGNLRFKDEKGKDYPKWEEKSLEEIGEFKNGINKGKEDFGFGFPFINLMDVFGKSTISNLQLDLVNANEKELKMYELKKGDVLFIRSSVKKSGVGEASLVLEDLNNTVFSGFLIRFRDNKTPFHLHFKRYCFSTPKFRNDLISVSSTSANTNINQESLNSLKIQIPSLQEQEKIAKFLIVIDTKIESVTNQITQTQTFKKGLLQQMFV